MSSYTTAILLSHLPGSVTKLVRAREILFSTFLTRNEGTIYESKTTFGMLSAGAIQLPREYFVFNSSQCIVNNRKLKMRRGRESQITEISNSLIRQNNNFARASHFLYISLPSTARLPVKMPNFMFCEGRKQGMTKFILFMNLDVVDRNSAPDKFACI